MPTLDEWQNALSVPRRVLVDSTEELAQTVNGKSGSASFEGEAKLAKGCAEFSFARTIRITGLELLNSIGRITTPRIENLVDLSSTWARIRYIWAFAPDNFESDLRLSEEALEIDFHQKALLSDEIGVGMAGFLIEKYFDGLNPVDIDIAVQDELIPGLTYQFSTSPDYLFQKSDGSYIVVECKGTRSGKGTALNQLKRGTEQVPSLEFPGGDEPLALVIGTCMSESSTTVYIIDPPSNKPLSSKDPRKVTIRDEKQFRDSVRDIQLSYLYLFAGATGKARDLIPFQKAKERLHRLPQREEPPQTLLVDSIGETYLGISQEVNLIGEVNRAAIFQGLSEAVYRSMHNRNRETILRSAEGPYQKAVKVSEDEKRLQNMIHQEKSSYIIDRLNRSLRADIFNRDGTFLRLEISNR